MEPKPVQIPKFTKRVLFITALIALIASIAGYFLTNQITWLTATPYGGLISILNLWLLVLFVTRLLTNEGGFDYKTLGLLVCKFLTLFGGLAAGIFLFKFNPLPLMVGFFSFFGGLLIESVLWATAPKM